jgi:hypothetical protein
MTIFEDLGKQYSSWRDRYFEDLQKSKLFAERFTHGFQKYIQAPDYFIQGYRDGERIKYVEAMKAVYIDDNSFTVDRENIHELLEHDNDDMWLFALVVRLEVDGNTFPKQAFPISIHFTIDGDVCKTWIAKMDGGRFNLRVSDHESYFDAYRFVVEYLSRAFQARASARFGEQRIGFVPL